MKVIFKITRFDSDTNSISVKFSYEKSRIPIDESRSYSIDLKNLDTYDYDSFSDSLIRNYGLRFLEEQQNKLETLSENTPEELCEKFEVRDLVGKVIEGKYHKRDRFPLKMRRVEL
tara:strand:+ start:2092 stop:2439 length:348 start_codon:yes stop_codon:yes gene_type:complete